MNSRCRTWPVSPLACSWTLAALLTISSAAAAGQSSESVQAPVAGTATPATTESEREAATLLKGMADYLAGLKSFSVTTRAGYDVVQSTGQKIEFGETRRLVLARPDRLRVEEVSSDGSSNLAVFDGRTMSMLNADAGVFAQAPQPGTIDDALVYFVRDLRMRMPLALLYTSRLPTEFLPRVRTVDYVESADIYGVPTHHIAGRTDTVDFQFWITEGEHPLPLRVVITYLHAAGQPQFWTNFTDWKANPQLSRTTFQFTPPKGARQIAFAVQVQRDAATQTAPADEEARP